MALPFFRKGKDKDKPAPTPKAARGAGRTQEPPTEPTPTLGMTLGMGMGAIVVDEASGAPQSSVDEAAILYASGQTKSAERLLMDTLDAGDRRGWHMLFDLFSLQDREREFEQLAVDYAVRFETSPPIWQPRAGSAAPGAAPQTQTATLELPGLLDRKAASDLREGVAAAAANDVIQIDFSRIAMVDEAGADDCVHILAAARKTGRKLRISGVERLIALLEDLTRATHSRAAHWLLLLELHQTLGHHDDFEDLAVGYAVHFEVSPPSWVDVQAAEVIQGKPDEPADDALHLSGEIAPANAEALRQFGDHAAAHDDVVVDLSRVTRIDYESVGQFISVLMQGLSSGKTITLRGHNALIHELFRVMGIDQLTQLVPHHRN
ncbi:MAG TPA: STAS domain-containing protein [Thiobacillaceae bacterium]|nr:STAS domain-containing protein [Thiobacillaceae bacterium]